MTNREAYWLITTLMELNVTPGTKLEHARNQTLKNATGFIEAHNDKLEDLNIEYCGTDEFAIRILSVKYDFHFGYWWRDSVHLSKNLNESLRIIVCNRSHKINLR